MCATSKINHIFQGAFYYGKYYSKTCLNIFFKTILVVDAWMNVYFANIFNHTILKNTLE